MSEVTLKNPHEQYLAELTQEPANGQPDWLGLIRKSGRAAFEASVFPHGKMEEWRHTNINAISNTHYRRTSSDGVAALSAPQLEGRSLAGAGFHELVFVDGHFSAALSNVGTIPDGALVGSFRDHLGTETLRAHLNQHMANRNAYTALNTASLKDGALVYVPRKTVFEKPVHLLFVSTVAAHEAAAHIRNVIVLDESSEATVISSYVGLDAATNYFNNVVEEVSVGANAQLRYYKVVQEGAAGNHLATTEIKQDRDSNVFSLVASLEGKVARNQLCVNMAGSGAECALHGLYLNDGDRLIDNAIDIHHTVPNCNSRIAYKGILDGNSKTVFTGKVNVDKIAQQTDSDQLSNNLLLSDSATLDTKPQLEIYADDVKCTHGATVGAHPEPIIFYFRSRGIDEAMARGMLTYGFADEIASEIEPDALRDRLRKYVYRKYSPKQ